MVLAFVLFSTLSTATVILDFVYSSVHSEVAQTPLDDINDVSE